MPRKALDKVVVTPELKNRQFKLKKFLRENNVSHKEIRPIGFEIDTRTIPKNKIEEFLEIANSVEPTTT